MKRLMDYWHKNAERFRLRSLRYYSQAIGGDPFTLWRVMVYEYDSLADWEYFEKQMEKDKKAMTLKDQLFANIDLKTRRVVEWQARALIVMKTSFFIKPIIKVGLWRRGQFGL